MLKWTLAAVAAVIAVFMLRQKDLHSTALSLIPPDPEDFDAAAGEEDGDRVGEPAQERPAALV